MSIKHIPGVELRIWLKVLHQKWLVELIGSFPPVIVAGIGVWQLAQNKATISLGYWAAGAAVWLVIASFFKIVQAMDVDRNANSKQDFDGLKAAMFVVHANVTRACGLSQDQNADVRVTFHRVVPPLNDPHSIEQLVPYAGGEGGGEGRKFSVRSGITGKCIRRKEPYTMHRGNEEDTVYQQELMAEYGYTFSDVKKLSSDKKSCMAVPVLDASGKHALGVVYFDSVHSNQFVSPDVQDAIVVACGGVAKYVSERYGR